VYSYGKTLSFVHTCILQLMQGTKLCVKKVSQGIRLGRTNQTISDPVPSRYSTHTLLHLHAIAHTHAPAPTQQTKRVLTEQGVG